MLFRSSKITQLESTKHAAFIDALSAAVDVLVITQTERDKLIERLRNTESYAEECRIRLTDCSSYLHSTTFDLNAARKVLCKLEWIRNDGTCPICLKKIEADHEPDCELYIALGSDRLNPPVDPQNIQPK